MVGPRAHFSRTLRHLVDGGEPKVVEVRAQLVGHECVTSQLLWEFATDDASVRGWGAMREV